MLTQRILTAEAEKRCEARSEEPRRDCELGEQRMRLEQTRLECLQQRMQRMQRLQGREFLERKKESMLEKLLRREVGEQTLRQKREVEMRSERMQEPLKEDTGRKQLKQCERLRRRRERRGDCGGECEEDERLTEGG